MNAQLLQELETIVGKIAEVQVLAEQGSTSEVRKIDTDSGSYVMKSAFHERYRHWLSSEAIVLQKLNDRSAIRLPHYYGYIEENDCSHLIMSFESGTTLTNALEQATTVAKKKMLHKSFGQLLQHFHELNIVRSLNSGDNWLNRQLLEAEHYLKLGQTEGNLHLFKKLELDKPIPVKQTMIHGDCTTDNVLVVNGKAEIFIDVAGMTVGDPRYDEALAIRKFKPYDEYLTAFYEGYHRYKISHDEYQYFEQGLYEFF